MKKFTFGFMLAIVAGCLVGCADIKGVYEGRKYVNKTLQLEIVPPNGWILEEMQNPFGIFVNFYSDKKRKTCIQITRGWLNMFLDSAIATTRDTIARNNTITSEHRATFNNKPAYIIEAIADKKYNATKKIILLVHKGRSYTILAYIIKDDDYSHNSKLITGSFSTIVLKD